MNSFYHGKFKICHARAFKYFKNFEAVFKWCSSGKVFQKFIYILHLDSIPSENVRKPNNFYFYEEQKRNIGLKWVNLSKTSDQAASPVNIYLFKVNNRNTRKRCKICSKLTINTPERRHWHCSDIFIVNFEHISHLFLVFLMLTLNK